MNPEKQRIAIAEFCGWQGVPVKQNTLVKDGQTYWRSQCPENLSKYALYFESSCVLRWLKKPDGKPFLVKVGPINVNHNDEYSLGIAIEYSKESGYGPAPKEVEPSLKAFVKYLPDYLNDLNAIHEAEKLIMDESSIIYVEYLGQISCPWHATAAQRAEALLKTIGKWEE